MASSWCWVLDRSIRTNCPPAGHRLLRPRNAQPLYDMPQISAVFPGRLPMRPTNHLPSNPRGCRATTLGTHAPTTQHSTTLTKLLNDHSPYAGSERPTHHQNMSTAKPTVCSSTARGAMPHNALHTPSPAIAFDKGAPSFCRLFSCVRSV